jgi:hypothetical protein
VIPACTPWHEAAHCLVGHVLGFDIRSVTVGEHGGWVNPGFETASSPEFAYHILMMAGAAGESAYWGDPDIGWEHARGDREHLARWGRGRHTELDLIGWQREASAIIEAQRPAWARLASVLAAGGTFPGATARRVLAGRTEPSDVRAMAAGLELRKAVPC